MKVIVAGAGSVGRYMAGQLVEAGHQVTLLEQDPGVRNRHSETEPRVQWAIGDGCEIDTLERSGAGEVDVVAAVTGDDEDNLVISLLAKQEFGVPRVVARVNNPNNAWMFNQMWGVDVSVSTPHLLTSLVEEAVNIGSFVRLLSLAQGTAHIAEVTLAEQSPAVGEQIRQLALPAECAVVGMLREGAVVAPHGDTVLRAGDEVLVLVSAGAESDVHAALVG